MERNNRSPQAQSASAQRGEDGPKSGPAEPSGALSMEKLSEWLGKNIGQPVQMPEPHGRFRGESEKEGAKEGGNGKGRRRRRRWRNPRGFAAPSTNRTDNNTSLRVIPLGGLDEVGKNMMIFEYGRDIVIVDMGFQFPEEDMLGVDYVIPDISYLGDKIKNIRGVLITHGHLDHIGAIPYLLNRLGNPPVFGGKLTMGLVEKRLDEFGLLKTARLNTVGSDDKLRLGAFSAEFFRVNHSIPDGFGIVLRTPEGIFVHTGDFKFDFTPAHQEPAEFSKIAQLGNENVLALFSDSTNALKPGHTVSEKVIGGALHDIIANAKGRIIIAAFASLIGRIQDIINIGDRYGRKVYLSGRSMVDNVAISKKLNYIKMPANRVFPLKKLNNEHDDKVLILTTGAQGESLSALTRMALGSHVGVQIKRGDTVVISASPIPGNESAITKVINNLCRLGAKVINNNIMDVHTSGHAAKEDLKLMINLVKPKYLVPIHGELFMRLAHAEIARGLGMAERNALVIENGDIMEFSGGEARKSREKAPANYIMIDGKGIGDVGAQVIMDRQEMAENGVLVILFVADKNTRKLRGDPSIISRGFIYMKESREMTEAVQKVAKKAYNDFVERAPKAGRGEIKTFVRSAVNRFVHKKIERRPMVLPILAEI